MVSSGDYELLAFDAKFNFLAIAKPTPGFVHRKLLPDISSKYRGIYFVVHCKKKGQFQLFIKTVY